MKAAALPHNSQRWGFFHNLQSGQTNRVLGTVNKQFDFFESLEPRDHPDPFRIELSLNLLQQLIEIGKYCPNNETILKQL